MGSNGTDIGIPPRRVTTQGVLASSGQSKGGVGANQGDPFFGLMEPFSGPTAPFLTVKLRGTIDKRLAILR